LCLNNQAFYLDGIIRSFFSVQAADGRLDDAGVLLDLEDGRSRVLVDDVLLDRVLQLGVRSLLQVVVVDGGHGHHHHAGGAVLSDVPVIDTLKIPTLH